MRVFLAGASGVLGRRIVPLLVDAGHQVTASGRQAAALEGLRALGADVVVADLFDAASVAVAVAGARPDLVMHQVTDLRGRDLAANGELRRTGTRNLVDAALAAGVGRVVAQSIAWAYQPGSTPAGEEIPLDVDAAEPRRTSVQGVAALEAQVGRVEHGVVLRYGMLYGPGTWYSPAGLYADAARAGKLPADADVTSFVHVEDAAMAAVRALDWPAGAVNVVDDEPAAGTAWVPAFCAAVGAPVPGVDGAGRHPFARGASNRYAREELGWTPRWPSWRAGFAEVAASG